MNRSALRYVSIAIVIAFLLGWLGFKSNIGSHVREKWSLTQNGEKPKKHPVVVYKPDPAEYTLIEDNFPLAERAQSAADLPPIPEYNAPPTIHVPESTPLFIGFTRNWPLLQQAVVSYLTAGWPASDIYVIDNTGTMNRNELGLLSLQNPFYLNHHRLTKIYNVNVITTPTLLTFAQLQNFYMHFALQNSWKYYFWSHMDVAILSDEEWKDSDGTYKSFYMRAVDRMREATSSESKYGKWSMLFFAYDTLTLVNLDAYMEVGGWDTSIGFYQTDCDMHFRLAELGDYKQPDVRAGLIFDAGSSLDLLRYYRRKPKDHKSWGAKDELGSQIFKDLRSDLDKIVHEKHSKEGGGRNSWQVKQRGGQGEPFYIPTDFFQDVNLRAIDFGKESFRRKWGWGGCDFGKAGIKATDAYKVERVDFIPDSS